MRTHNRTDTKLAFWINEYLLHCRQESMANLGVMSTAMREAADSQDKIGWGNVLHGKVSTMIMQIQNSHCVLAGSNMNGSNWTTQFIQHLIHISHLQWLFQNFTFHHHIKGYLRICDEAAIQQEVANLLDTSPQSIPRKSRYLLEIQYQPKKNPPLSTPLTGF
jgi:hypothetical protein